MCVAVVFRLLGLPTPDIGHRITTADDSWSVPERQSIALKGVQGTCIYTNTRVNIVTHLGLIDLVRISNWDENSPRHDHIRSCQAALIERNDGYVMLLACMGSRILCVWQGVGLHTYNKGHKTSIYTHTHPLTQITHTHTLSLMHTHTLTHMYSHNAQHTLTHTYALTLTCTHTHKHAHTLTHRHTNTHSHTNMHSLTHSHTMNDIHYKDMFKLLI